MSKRLIVVLAGLLAVALAVVGCGGGDDEEATASSITKAEFIKQADAACERGEDRVQAAFIAYGKEKSKEGKKLGDPGASYGDLVEEVMVPNFEQEIEELRDLGSPGGDEAEVEAILEAREEALDDARAEPKLIILDSGKVFGRSSELAREYGLTSCSTR